MHEDFPTTVGFELEFESTGPGVLKRIKRTLERHGYSTLNVGGWARTGRDNLNWELKTDSSCGYEAASPVISTLSQLQRHVEVGKIIQEEGGTTTDRCGLHFHVGVTQLRYSAFCRMIRMCLRYEDAMFLLVSSARHRSVYCKKVVPFQRDQIQTTLRRNMVWGNDVGELVNPRWFQDASYMNGDRRSWINTSPILRLGTVEFRLFDATLDPDQLKETALFLMHMIDGAVKGRNCRWGKADSESREILLRSMLSAMGFYTTTPEEDNERAKICRKWATKMARDHGWIAQEQRRGRRAQPRNPDVTVVRDDARNPDRVTHVYIRRPRPVTEPSPAPPRFPYVPTVWTGTSTSTPVFITSATSTSTVYEITTSGDWNASWDSTLDPGVSQRVQEQMNAAVQEQINAAAREAAFGAATTRALHGVLTPQVPDRLMHALLHDA